jgi:hypothetical protein
MSFYNQFHMYHRNINQDTYVSTDNKNNDNNNDNNNNNNNKLMLIVTLAVEVNLPWLEPNRIMIMIINNYHDNDD